MNLNRWLIRAIIKLYPRAWRQEYGEEFKGLLLADPLTGRAAGDAIIGAARQHLRYGKPRNLLALFLCSWTLVWTAWNSLAPLSPAGYSLFCALQWVLWLLCYFGAGWWTFTRRRASIWQGVSAAAIVALAGIAPDVGLLILRDWGILPVALIDAAGTIQGYGIALLNLRGSESMLLYPNFPSAFFPVVNGALGAIFGFMGALAARIAHRPASVQFRDRPRRRSI